MSDVVDTKIVEAKFDSKDFEKGVNRTIKKLDELKKSLNMKDTGKSMAEFAKETSESTEKAAGALEKLSNRMTTFVGQIKQQIVSGLAGEVSGAFLSMERSISSFFHTITSGSINSGMSRYTEILTAVRTMTAAGKDQSKAYEQIKRLAEYSDQTSYSLSTMAGSMSKMVAAGADLDVARKSVEGLANMAAAAGVNIYDATRAFTNFTQAYSSGSMRMQDWMSFESLNMATENTMKIFMEAAVQAGTLKKEMKTVVKDGKKIQQEVFKTTNKTNKKVTSGKQVAIKGFRDSLRYLWLDQETMQIATAIKSYVEELGISIDDLSKEQLEEFRYKAYLSAKEARSFSDVMGTLKDVLATGWSNTFEQIFGPLDKATDFFTKLADSNLLGILYDLSDYRNAVLEQWNTITVDGKNGSDIFKEALLNIDDAIGAVSEKFKKLVPSAESFGDWLFKQTYDFRTFTENLNEWLTTNENGFSRAQKIAMALKTIGTIVHVVGRVIGTAWSGVTKVLSATAPVFDAVLTALMNFSTHLMRMDRDTTIFEDLSTAFSNVATVVGKLSEKLAPVIGIIEKLIEFFVDTALSTAIMNVQLIADGLGFLIEVFGGTSAQQLKNNGGGVLKGITDSIKDMKAAVDGALGAVKEFFGGLFEDLKKILGLGEQTEGEEGGFFNNIRSFFETNQFVKDAKAWIDQAIIDIGTFIKGIPDRIKNFGINIGKTIRGLFYTTETRQVDVDENGKKIFGEVEIATPLKEWIDKVLLDIKNFIHSIPERVANLAKQVGTFAGNVLDAILTFFVGEQTPLDTGKRKSWEFDDVDAQWRDPANSGLNKLIASAKAFIKDIPNKVITGLKNVGTIISNFMDGLFYETKTVNISKNKYNQELVTVKVRRPLLIWLRNAINDVVQFIKDIPKNVQAGLKQTKSIIKTFVGALMGKENGEEATSQEIIDALKAPFEGLTLGSVISKIKDVGLEFINAVVGIFTGTDDLEENKKILGEKVSGAITWIKDKAKGAWETVSDWFVNLPHTIASFFSPEETGKEINKQTSDPGPIETAIKDFGNTVGKFIEKIPDNLLTFVDNTVNELDRLWKRLYHALTGQGEYKENYDPRLSRDPQHKKLINTINELAPEDSEIDVSQWDLFVKHLGETISNIFAKLPEFIATGIDLAIKGIDAAIGWIGGWFQKENIADKVAKNADVGKEIADGLSESTDEDAKQQSGLVVAIGNICASISKLITETVPGALTAAWNYVANNAGNWWDSLSNILGLEGYSWKDLQSDTHNIAQKIVEFIEEIPSYIKIGADFFDKIWNGVWVEGKDVDEAGKKAFYKIRSGGLKRTITKFISDFGDEIKNAFVTIGPTILDGITSALEWINKGFNWLTNFFKGRDKDEDIGDSLAKAVAGEKDENKALAESMQKLGNTLKITLVDTIPPFIEAGVEEVATKVPSLLDRILGVLIPSASAEEMTKEAAEAGAEAVNKAVESVFNGPNLIGDMSASGNPYVKSWNKEFPSTQESKDGEKRAEGAISFMDAVNNLINSVGNIASSPVVHLAALAGLIALALNALKDIFALSDNAEEWGEGFKATGIGIALMAIGMIIGEMAYFVATNDTKKLEQAEGVLNTVASVIERILTKVEWILGLSSAGKAFEMLNSRYEMKSLLKGGVVKAGATAAASGGISGLVAGLIGGLTAGGLASAVNTFLTDFMAPFNTIASGLKTFGENMGPALKTIADMNDDLTRAMAFPGNFYNFLKEMTQSIGSYATGAFGVGDDAYDYISNLQNQNGYNISDIMKALTERQDLIFGVATFFKNLSAGLSQYGSLKNPNKTIKDITSLIASDDFGVFLKTLNMTFNNWLEPFGPEQLKDIGVELDYVGSALGVFTNSFDSLTADNVSALQGSLEILEKLVYAISGGDSGENLLRKITTGESNIAKFGSQIQQFGTNFRLFFDDIKKIVIVDKVEAEMMQNKINMAIGVVRGFAAAATNAFNTTAIEALDALTNKMDGVDGLGQKIATFINNIGWALAPDMDLETFDKIQMAVETFANLTGAIHDLSDTNITNGMNKIDEFIKAMFGADLNDPNTIIDYVSQFTKLMNLAITDDMELSPKIVPIIDMQNIDDAFAARFGDNWMFNADSVAQQAVAANPDTALKNQNGEQISPDLSGIVAQLTSIISTLGTIDTNVSKMGTMQVDSEATIAYFGPLINQYLNDEQTKSER